MFSIADHRKHLATHRAAAQAAATTAALATLEAHKATLSTTQQRRIDRCTETGGWLSAIPNVHARTQLSAQEWHDNLLLRYGLTPPQLPATCDGCGRASSVIHALNCGCGGLIHLRHNELRDELISIASESFPKSAITREPQLSATAAPTLPTAHPIHAALPVAPDPPQQPPVPVAATPAHLRGDLGIRGLNELGTTAIIDVRVVNLDSPSLITRAAPSVIQSTEDTKISKYQPICQSRRESFHPFVVSVDGMLGPQSVKILQQLAQHQSDNVQRPYSVVMHHLRQRTALALARSAHMCLRVSRDRRYNTNRVHSVPPPSVPPPNFLIQYG